MNIDRLNSLLGKFPRVKILVVGDFFLDEYLSLDARLTEPSLETGLDAYQVVARRVSPGAAGTVTNNLRALGAEVTALGIIGDDGEGLELERALRNTGVDCAPLLKRADRFTPTYTKPMLKDGSGAERELNRIDTKNRTRLPFEAEDELCARLRELVPQADAVIAVDQVEETDCGVITARVRGALGELAEQHPAKIFAVESRANIGRFRNMILKPNARELQAALEMTEDAEGDESLERGLRELQRRTGREIFLTEGEAGMHVCDADGIRRVRTVRVTGPIDIVGAGDSALAGIVMALAAGATTDEAALIGNLAAAVTIRQLGTTGTANPAQILDAYLEWVAQG